MKCALCKGKGCPNCHGEGQAKLVDRLAHVRRAVSPKISKLSNTVQVRLRVKRSLWDAFNKVTQTAGVLKTSQMCVLIEAFLETGDIDVACHRCGRKIHQLARTVAFAEKPFTCARCRKWVENG